MKKLSAKLLVIVTTTTESTTESTIEIGDIDAYPYDHL